MAIANNTFDISLQQDSSAVEYGFMLAKKNGAKQWHVGDAPALSPQFFTASASYASLPPEQEMVIAQDEWHANYGLQDTFSGDEKRYRTSYGVDARQKGRVYNGPASSTLTLPTGFAPAPIIWNAGFEHSGSTDGGSTTFWTLASTATWIPSATVQAGTVSIWYASTVASTSYQAISDWAAYTGTTLQFTMYTNQDAVNRAKIYMDDGVSTYASATTAATAAWTLLTATGTISSSATQLRFYMQALAGAGSIRFDTAAATVTAGTTITTGNYGRYMDYNSSLYLSRGAQLLKFTGTGNWTYVKSFPDTISDMAVLGSQLVVAAGTVFPSMYFSGTSDDTTWTDSPRVIGAVHLATIGSNLHLNNAAASVGFITSSTSGFAGATALVGNATTSITELEAHTGLLYIGKTDQPYERAAAGTGTVSPILPEAVSEASSTSCKNMRSFKGDLYIPTGTQALWRWGSATDIETVSPSKFAVAESDFGGLVQALANDSEYLYAAVDKAASTEILSLREETIDGDTDWRWHPIAQLTHSTVNHMWVSTVGSKRLWVCGATGDTPTFYYLPANYADPYTDTTYNRNTSGIFYTPWYSGGFIDITKAFFSVTLLSSGLTAARTIAVDYQLLGDSSWTTGWTFGLNDSPSKINYFPADKTSKKIRFKMTFASDSATTGPLLNGLIIRGALMPTKRKRFQFVVRVADNIVNRRGGQGQYMATALATALKAYDAEAWPVIFRDRENTSFNVKLIGFEEVETIDEESRNPERHFTIDAVECKIS